MGKLLEKAKSIKSTRAGRPNAVADSPEAEELIIAYLQGHVTRTQVAGALKISHTNVSAPLASLFLSLYRSGRIVIKPRPRTRG